METCGRCGLRTHDTYDQITHCAYCAENCRRIAAGEDVLQQPTENHPAGRPGREGE